VTQSRRVEVNIYSRRRGGAAVRIWKGKAVEGESFVVGRGKGSLFALEGGKNSRWCQEEKGLPFGVEKGEGSAAVRI
jgi:hypothetical protein